MITSDDLAAKIASAEVARTFVLLERAFSSMDGMTTEPEKHGYISSLRIRRGKDWSFSISPAANWLLFYVRRPELKRGRLNFARVREVFPDAKQRKDGEITVRLLNEGMGRRMVALVQSA